MALFGRLIVASMPLAPKFIVKRVAMRYVAGSEMSDAIMTMHELSAEGACFTVDVLGEEISSMDEASYFHEEYSRLLDAIQEHGLNANISIKPTAFGLLINRESAYSNIESITRKAQKLGSFVRLDMEDSRVTQETIDVMLAMHSKGLTNIGVVLQGRLYRTESDIDSVCSSLGDKSDFRICKGIYLESEDIAHTKYSKIVEATNAAVTSMLERGAYTAIASHDIPVIEHALAELRSRGMTDGESTGLEKKGPGYEFQFLLGVRGDVRRDLASKGHLTRVYVPYGTRWYEYGIRRLRENPEVASHVVKALLMPWTNRR
ncbi:MAG: proline dehydrogenase [Methanobacteriota archaeon]|jgi:proline dehydrogenase|nr:proline dehydrogenase [Euryarchaeota archaeon]RAH17128.1 MAG: proline dehydrogenase [Euryarchaeota archaeon]|tara:strand:- start:2454 stop:3407 length:954 start_codon:yes stop_codon:yes gene_type:complete